jgi:hypothetical protein
MPSRPMIQLESNYEEPARYAATPVPFEHTAPSGGPAVCGDEVQARYHRIGHSLDLELS